MVTLQRAETCSLHTINDVFNFYCFYLLTFKCSGINISDSLATTIILDSAFFLLFLKRSIWGLIGPLRKVVLILGVEKLVFKVCSVTECGKLTDPVSDNYVCKKNFQRGVKFVMCQHLDSLSLSTETSHLG